MGQGLSLQATDDCFEFPVHPPCFLYVFNTPTFWHIRSFLEVDTEGRCHVCRRHTVSYRAVDMGHRITPDTFILIELIKLYLNYAANCLVPRKQSTCSSALLTFSVSFHSRFVHVLFLRLHVECFPSLSPSCPCRRCRGQRTSAVGAPVILDGTQEPSQ